jgi:hypothetical protein
MPSGVNPTSTSSIETDPTTRLLSPSHLNGLWQKLNRDGVDQFVSGRGGGRSRLVSVTRLTPRQIREEAALTGIEYYREKVARIFKTPLRCTRLRPWKRRTCAALSRTRRLGAGRQFVRRIDHRRVKVRWVTPLGEETVSMS